MHVFVCVYVLYMHVCAHICGGVLARVSIPSEVRSQLLLLFTLCLRQCLSQNVKLPDSASKPLQAYDSGTCHATTPICMWVLESKFRASHWATATFPTERSPQLSAHLFPMPASLGRHQCLILPTPKKLHHFLVSDIVVCALISGFRPPGLPFLQLIVVSHC